MSKLIILFCTMLSILFTQLVYAIDKDLDELIQDDRQERIQRINEITIELNKSLVELKNFQNDLDMAIANEKKHHSLKVFIRNSTSILSAIGFASTIIFQFKGINPQTITLVGGYGMSALLSIIGLLENRSIFLTKEEISRLKASVKDLEKRITIEKNNLAKEIRLLCLGDGGSPEVCNQFQTAVP